MNIKNENEKIGNLKMRYIRQVLITHMLDVFDKYDIKLKEETQQKICEGKYVKKLYEALDKYEDFVKMVIKLEKESSVCSRCKRKDDYLCEIELSNGDIIYLCSKCIYSKD